jgi:hypothetical protein
MIYEKKYKIKVGGKVVRHCENVKVSARGSLPTL